jgi:hypothetical protein
MIPGTPHAIRATEKITIAASATSDERIPCVDIPITRKSAKLSQTLRGKREEERVGQVGRFY